MISAIHHTIEDISAATIAQKGGRYRTICNRNIDGKKCRCYIKEVLLGETYYWNVFYVVDGKEPPAYNYLVERMLSLVRNAKDSFLNSRKKIVLWTY